MPPRIDQRDIELIAHRWSALVERETTPVPQVGDIVHYGNPWKPSETRRVSHVWPASADHPELIQTSSRNGGSYYLSEVGVSYSGALYPAAPVTDFARSDWYESATFWIFHHGLAKAANGVDFQLPRPVWRCSSNPT